MGESCRRVLRRSKGVVRRVERREADAPTIENTLC